MKNDEVRLQGESAEQRVLQVLQYAGRCYKQSFTRENQYGQPWREECLWYDIELQLDRQTRWIEVKLDKQTAIHNNVAIEIACDSYSDNVFKPSGINTSKAEYWFILTPEGRYWFVDLYTLRRLAYSREEFQYTTILGETCSRGVKETQGVHSGDTNVTTMLRCIPIPMLEANCIAYGECIEEFDIKNIL